MITIVRSATIHQDADVDAAYEWAIKVAAYLTENVGMDAQAHRNVAGPVFQVHWISRVESLAQVEQVMQGLQTDEGYGALLVEARDQGFFERSNLTDHLYQSIP